MAKYRAIPQGFMTVGEVARKMGVTVRTLQYYDKEGLLSLQQQLAALAEETPGSHIHYDEYNSLEEGSSELIIEKE